MTADSADIENHCIETLSLPIPGRPGKPAAKVASKMKEFPVAVPFAFPVERLIPPPVSPGFFQI